MRIALVSDLHLEFRERGFGEVPSGHFHLYGAMSFPETVDADVLVIAGDTHPNPAVRKAVFDDLRKRFSMPVITVDGNHDFYHGSFPDDHAQVLMIDGVRFAFATMWTLLDDATILHKSRMNDFRRIEGVSQSRWNALFAAHVMELRVSNAEVIITHHAPFLGSCHPRYRADPLNRFFVNDLDANTFPSCRLWLHGHVHDPVDYVEGHIRVVANPHAYPDENPSTKVVPQIIDL